MAAKIDADDFESSLRSLARLSRVQLDLQSRLEVLLLRAECHFGMRQLSKAQEIIRTLEREDLARPQKLRLELLGAHCMAFTGKVRQAFHQIVPILREAETHDEFRARALRVAGLALYRSGHYCWSAEMYKLGAAYYRLAGRRVNLAGMQINLGLIAKSRGRLDLALDYFDEAARLLASSRNPVARLRLLLNRGICLFKLGQVEGARSCFLEAESLAIAKRSHDFVTVIYLNLGHIYRTEGNFELAREYYTEALRTAESSGAERNACLALEFLGEASIEEGRPAEALVVLNRAHGLAKQIAGRGDLMMEVLRRRGEAHAALGNRTEALEDLGRAIQLCSSRGERREQVLAERAHAFIASKSEDELARCILEVLTNLRDLGDRFEYARTVYLILEDGRLDRARHPWFEQATATAMHYFGSLSSRLWSNRLQSLLGHRRKIQALEGPIESIPIGPTETRSSAFAATLDAARVAARSTDPVLILGETGAGKEVVAGLVHAWGPRANAPLLAINCGALPENLVESELFGHVRGAFTGAERDKTGLLEAARDGSVLLDEVADLPLTMQVKLLRFIDTGELRRLGDERPRRVEVRVLAATNGNIVELVRDGRFREDLYYRLNVFCIEVPPLRERREDILILAESFLRDAAQSTLPIRLHSQLSEWMLDYDWPGNVRQLRNVCRYLAAKCWGQPEIGVGDLPPALRPRSPELPPSSTDPFEKERLELERSQISKALAIACGNVSTAAKLLRMSRNTVHVRMRQYGLDRRTFTR